MAILKTLFKTLSGSASHLVRYRQSFKLRDALIELENYGYISLLITDETLEIIDGNTDLTQCKTVIQIIVRKSFKLIIVSEKLTQGYFGYFEDKILREFINKQLPKLGISTKSDAGNFDEYLLDIAGDLGKLPFLQFSDSFNVTEYEKERDEISSKRMIEIVLEEEERMFSYLPLSAHTK